MRIRLLDPLLEGEPDGANGAETTLSRPESATTDLADGSKTADAKVSDPNAGGDGAAADGGTDGGAGADGGDSDAKDVVGALTPEQIAALPDEDVDAFVELFGERIASSKVMQERIDRAAQAKRDKEAAEQARRPDNDPFYRELTDASQRAHEGIQDIVRKVAAGEDIDLAGLPVHIAEAGQWVEASERRGQILVTDAVVRRALGLSETEVNEIATAIEAGETDKLDPVQRKYVEARAALDAGQRQAHRLMRDTDPENRKKAPYTDATTAATFIASMMETMEEYGEAKARATDEKSIKTRVDSASTLAGSNAFREAQALAAKTRQAAVVGATGGLNGKSNNETTLEQFQAMDPKATVDFKKSNPREYNRLLRLSNGMTEE